MALISRAYDWAPPYSAQATLTVGENTIPVQYPTCGQCGCQKWRVELPRDLQHDPTEGPLHGFFPRILFICADCGWQWRYMFTGVKHISIHQQEVE